MSARRVGVLALQGDFEPHLAVLEALGEHAVEVRSPDALDDLTHLLIPGGESTTLQRLMQRFGFLAPLVDAHARRGLALMGTCAGAILLGRPFGDSGVPPRLELVDAAVERNAYGRQVHSARRRLVPCVPALAGHESGLFIRAPRIRRLGPSLTVLLHDEAGDPVVAASERVWIATHHPELDGETRVHAAFLAATTAGAGLARATS